jgi:hypothetical protein
MEGVRYEAPETLQAAVALLAGAAGTARILAGGTDVIVQMETELIEPALLVDIKKIRETRQIVSENGGFRVGAAVPGMAIVEHAALCKAWPGVIDGVKLIGSIQIKGRATVGGNLCNASPAADSVPALVAAGAVARIAGAKGMREAPVETIPIGPGRTSLGIFVKERVDAFQSSSEPPGPVPAPPAADAMVSWFVCGYFLVSAIGIAVTKQLRPLRKFAAVAHLLLLIAVCLLCSEGSGEDSAKFFGGVFLIVILTVFGLIPWHIVWYLLLFMKKYDEPR